MWWEIIKKGEDFLPKDILPIVKEILKSYNPTHGKIFTQQQQIVRLRLSMSQSTFEGNINNYYQDVVKVLISVLRHVLFETGEDEYSTYYDCKTRYYPLHGVFSDGPASDTRSFPVKLHIDVSKDWTYFFKLTDSVFSTAEQKLEALKATNILPQPLSQLDPQDRQTVRSIIEG